ncbi:hypothetical protein SAMN05660841_00360 [Sphingobacterium nematocida]|uniref:Four helix bundle protein n=1 Tax=Sphingobacterium nematocida TaxID=1513896 RepID=A0A1T5B0U9_9SPHI|nr:hypothetical protein [Sphingobacterium nematocida]SKB40844.1 hypothetical protein SAMN05660841_00360 [Sphingobacterium nematocida]
MDDLFGHELPEWDNDRFRRDDDEDWKIRPRWETAERLYAQCSEIFNLCKLLTDSLSGEWQIAEQQMIMSNISIVGAKIVGAASADLYILHVEKAAIIRQNMRELREQLIMLEMMQTGNSRYCQLILQEIERFKGVFKIWVSHFKRDDVEDDWGLF